MSQEEASMPQHSPGNSAPSSSAGDTGSTQGSGLPGALQTISGLLAVTVGLTALTIIALVGMGFVKTDNPSVASIATGSFGVIGTIVGAYFGVKVGGEGTQKAIDGLKDESAKAQAFASHMDSGQADRAVATYERLRSR
jgi:hypothetical protein